MAIIKKSEFKEMSVKELEDKLAGLYTESMKDNARRASGGGPEATKMVRARRRMIAKIKTKLREKGVKV